jgi:anti-sigma factor RsiW
MSHDDLTCQKLILECLLEFEDGTMPEAERRELERHFEWCPPCLHFLSTYRATGKCLKMLKPTDIPPALAQTVIAFVRSRREKEKG